MCSKSAVALLGVAWPGYANRSSDVLLRLNARICLIKINAAILNILVNTACSFEKRILDIIAAENSQFAELFYKNEKARTFSLSILKKK